MTSFLHTLLVLSVATSVDAAQNRHLRQVFSEQSMLGLSSETHVLEAAVFYSVAGLLSLISSLVLVCLLLDTALAWKHKCTFWSCQRQVRQVHAALMKAKEDLSLCPYCVECTLTTPQQKKVKFICGHGYHLSCINKWFTEHPNAVGCCPVCEVAKDGATNHQCCSYEGDTGSCQHETLVADEAQHFILKSLNRRYPAIISQECVERWANCNTEIWLSELTCPRYNSMFKHLLRRSYSSK
jgi:hypothetical protein